MKAQILSHLPQGFPWGRTIQFYDCVDSTNRRARELAAAGAPGGTVLIADRQTAGRGRLGRTFQSPPGKGIYLSVILRPNCPPQDLMHLTCAAAVAMCDAVEAVSGFRPGVKWINDLVAGKRKLAGILTELTLSPKTGLVDCAIVGIGINVCQQPEDFSPELRDTACSLAMVTGKTLSRPALCAAMIQSLHRMDTALRKEKQETMARYRGDCVTLGCRISVIRGDTLRRGQALDLDADGGLVVRFDDGQTETVSSGEVSVRGMYGYV